MPEQKDSNLRVPVLLAGLATADGSSERFVHAVFCSTKWPTAFAVLIGFKLISPSSPGEMRAGKNGHACCFVKLSFGSDSGTKKGNKIQGRGALEKS